MRNYIYVDYENMNNLKELPTISNAKYFFFVGAKQNSIPTSLVLAQENNEVKWIKSDGTGKDALDFYIVYHLAKNDTEKEVLHYILSKDTGFDPLITTINREHNSEIVKRITNLTAVNTSCPEPKKSNKPKIEKSSNENYATIVATLKKAKSKSSLPKKEKNLRAYIKHSSKIKNLSDRDLNNILEMLFKNNIINKNGSNIIYSL